MIVHREQTEPPSSGHRQLRYVTVVTVTGSGGGGV